MLYIIPYGHVNASTRSHRDPSFNYWASIIIDPEAGDSYYDPETGTLHVYGRVITDEGDIGSVLIRSGFGLADELMVPSSVTTQGLSPVNCISTSTSARTARGLATSSRRMPEPPL